MIYLTCHHKSVATGGGCCWGEPSLPEETSLPCERRNGEQASERKIFPLLGENCAHEYSSLLFSPTGTQRSIFGRGCGTLAHILVSDPRTESRNFPSLIGSRGEPDTDSVLCPIGTRIGTSFGDDLTHMLDGERRLIYCFNKLPEASFIFQLRDVMFHIPRVLVPCPFPRWNRVGTPCHVPHQGDR